MKNNERFGDYFRRMRTNQRISLRKFCKIHGFDAGNISKLERGIMAPPQNEELRLRYAEALGIKKGTDDWLTFCDLASAESGLLPKDISEDEEVLKRLPVLFRTIRDAKLSDEEIDRLIHLVRKETE